MRLGHRCPSIRRLFYAVEQGIVHVWRYVLQNGLPDDEVAERLAGGRLEHPRHQLLELRGTWLVAIAHYLAAPCAELRTHLPTHDERELSHQAHHELAEAHLARAAQEAEDLRHVRARLRERWNASAGGDRAGTGVVGRERQRHRAEAAEQVPHQVGLGVDGRLRIEWVEQRHRLGSAGHELGDALGAGRRACEGVEAGLRVELRGKQLCRHAPALRGTDEQWREPGRDERLDGAGGTAVAAPRAEADRRATRATCVTVVPGLPAVALYKAEPGRVRREPGIRLARAEIELGGVAVKALAG